MSIKENDKHTAQLQGPFVIGENLVAGHTLSKLGIITEPKNRIELNDNITVQIGKTGIYEINNVTITSLKFLNKTDTHSYINFIMIE